MHNYVFPDEWEALTKLIPELEQTKDFTYKVINENGQVETKVTQVISDFYYYVRSTAISHGLSDEDIEKGRIILEDLELHLNQLDLFSISLLFSFMIIEDLETKGALIRYFENGQILRIIQQLKIILIE